MGYGAATEVGPLRVEEGGDALRFNNYSWNREANLLFLESPVGVGFSYTNTSSDLAAIDDNFVAQDSYNFLANWFQRFPQFKNHDLFIAGESYAGHYVPQLAEIIFDRNKDKKKYSYINLKGFIVGNPSMDNYNDNKGYLDYAWSHAVISDELYHEAKRACNFASSTWSNECIEVMTNISNAYNEIEDLNLYAPKCLMNYPSSSSSSSATRTHHMQLNSRLTNKRNIAHAKKEKSKQIPGSFATCYSTYVDEYFNKIEVQKAFSVLNEIKWNACNNELLNAYNLSIISVFPVYEKLIKAGLKIWIYSGDLDGNVPVIGTRYCIDALKLSLKSQWRVWFHNHQVGGRVIEYNGLTFVTVRGAGHLVPLDKPSEALAIIHSFLYGEELPRER
ncbi:unnamed protein product [Cuscuta campestris]|uniref:Carboxypeptidase n=1 Tax=Cuscuta campestris TaxID=132261 RepID=A0A484KIC1_9ASTE|nr:unnamed protein product [Cuscuta campestris]